MEIMGNKEEMNKLASLIFQLNPSLRGVGFIDHNDNTLFSKMNENKISLMTNIEEEKFAADLQIIKKTQDELNDKLGEVTFSHIIREKLQQLIYNVNNVTIYVTCEPNVDHNTIVEISKLIKDTLEEYQKVRSSVTN